ERGADLVVATRYAGAGSAGGLSSRLRGLASRGAGAAAKVLFPRALAGGSDPMGGVFAVRTAAGCPRDLRPRGFKILLEVLVRTPGLRVAEVPFTFAERHDGQSKASAREAARYLRQLAALRLAVAGRAGRLARFAVAGGSGVLGHLGTLAVLLRVTRGALAAGAGGQMIAAVAATQAAVGWNFVLTERWVFPGRPGHWAARLLPFWALSCGALLAQLPLAARLQPVLGGSYVLATGAALTILMLARFAACDRWLYRPAKRSPATAPPCPAPPPPRCRRRRPASPDGGRRGYLPRWPLRPSWYSAPALCSRPAPARAGKLIVASADAHRPRAAKATPGRPHAHVGRLPGNDARFAGRTAYHAASR